MIFWNNPVLAQVENSCVDCHKKPEIISSLPALEQNIFEDWRISVHGSKGITCEKCMGGNPTKFAKEAAHEGIKNSSNPKSPVYYKNLPETCGECHSGVYKKFTQSRHYQRLKANELAPECSTCHGSHNVALVEPLEISKKCSLCHNIETRIMPSIPREAEGALAIIKQVKNAVLKAESAIEVAREKRRDTTKAEVVLQEAKSILGVSGDSWHDFEIYAFKEELVNALYYADRAYNLASALAENSCVSCHSTLPRNTTTYEKYSEWLDSSHVDKGIACDSCHRGKADNESLRIAHQGMSIPNTVDIPTMCWNCHKNHQYFESKHWKKLLQTLETESKKFPHGVYQDKIELEKQPLTGPECATCHGSHDIKGTRNPESPVYYKNILKTCGLVCHKNEYNKFMQSKHYVKLKADKLAPECVTCHGSMAISVLNASGVSNFCSMCHNKEMGIYPNIPKDAENTMLLLARVGGVLDAAQNSVNIAKKEREIRKAEDTLRNARNMLAEAKGSWHGFNITAVGEELNEAAALGRLAKEEAEGTVSSPLKYILVILIFFIVVYFILRKIYKQ
ncbi:hypothetical protein HZB01_05140 [Candidatus Woesearchaeota archaeon]|nr:hypothetical protein [Candidatus Woesearchaeota archaeon]